jgi:hypothetical protein
LVRSAYGSNVEVDPPASAGLVEEELRPVVIRVLKRRRTVVLPFARRLPEADCKNSILDALMEFEHADLQIQDVLGAQAWDRSRANVVDPNRQRPKGTAKTLAD